MTAHPTLRPALLLAASLAILATAACGGAEQPSADSTAATAEVVPAMSGPSVEILSPADGDSVSLPFTIRLGSTGVEIVPASGVREEGKGHHHIVFDDGQPIDDSQPLGTPPSVIHLGDGSAERVIETLSPGPHRIVAILAWGDHVPMTDVKRDTVNVVVR